MHLALIGASGFVGSALRTEALARDHRVTALVHHPERLQPAEHLIVGGAGSLEVAPGKLLYDTPDFPLQWKATSRGALDALRALRMEPILDWTVLTPAAEMTPGKRTDKFRLGDDQLLVDGEGKSRISVEDFAVAMIDELETPRYPRKRFTVAC